MRLETLSSSSTKIGPYHRILVATALIAIALLVSLTVYVAFFESKPDSNSLRLEVDQASLQETPGGLLTSSIGISNLGSQEFQVAGRLDSFFLPDYTFARNNVGPRGSTLGVASAAWNITHFNGLDGFIQVPDSSTLNPLVFTVEIGFKYENSGQDPQMIIGKGSAGGNSFYFFNYRSASNLNDFVIYENNTRFDQSLGNVFAEGRWYDVAFTVNGTVVSAYVDGTLENSWAHSVLFKGNTNDLFLGKCVCGGYDFNGSLAFARLYDRALSALEIQRNQDPTSVSQSGLVMSLSANHISGPLMTDQSGHGNDGRWGGDVSFQSLTLGCRVYFLLLTLTTADGGQVMMTRPLKLGC